MDIELEKQKILEAVNELNDTSISSKNISDFPQLDVKYQQMLSDSENEIAIELIISVLSRDKNDSTALPSTRQMYINNYCIPVPSGENSEEYTLAFIKYLEKSMSNSIQ